MFFQECNHPILSLSFFKGGHGLLTCDSSGLIQRWSNQGIGYSVKLPKAFSKFSLNKYPRYSRTITVVENYNSPGFLIQHDTTRLVFQCIETGILLLTLLNMKKKSYFLINLYIIQKTRILFCLFYKIFNNIIYIYTVTIRPVFLGTVNFFEKYGPIFTNVCNFYFFFIPVFAYWNFF